MVSPQVPLSASRNSSVSSTTSPSAPQGRRHSSFEPIDFSSLSPDSRRGSAASAASDSRVRRGSDTPSWLTSMNQRNAAIKHEGRKDSLVKGLFGKRKTKAEKEEAELQKQRVLAHFTLKNNLKADPRGARKVPVHSPAAEKANTESLTRGPYITAKELEERRPHSGPVTRNGTPMLTTIVSDWDAEEDRQNLSDMLHQSTDVAHQIVTEDKNANLESESHHPSSSRTPDRRVSVQEGDLDSGQTSPRRLSGFGGWYRNDEGRWTRDGLRKTSA